MKTLSNDIIGNFSKYNVFTYGEVKSYLKSKGRSTKNLARTLSYLKTTGRLYTVIKGVYSVRRESIIAGFAFKPFYYGLLSAMTIRELWTQNSRLHIITGRHVRHSELIVFGNKNDRIFLHHTPMKYYFGFDMMDYAGVRVPVSDSEKTLIDLFYFRVKLATQDYSDLLKDVNVKKVKEYLNVYDRHTAKIVMNFIDKYKKLADKGRLDSPY